MGIKIVRGTEEINSIGGISLIGNHLKSLKILKSVDFMSFDGVKAGTISHSDMLKGFIGLLCLGKTNYADIELYRKDMFFKDSLELGAIPSESILRQRLDAMGVSESVLISTLTSNVELLSKALDFGTEKTAHSEYTVLDADVSTLDNSGSKKEGVSWTYAKIDGYAPIFCYIGTHGYMLNCELRPGSQHSNKNIEEFLSSVLDSVKKLEVKNPLFRMDSAHDDAKVMKMLTDNDMSFIIKRNIRGKSKEQLLDMAKSIGNGRKMREGKTAYIGALGYEYPELGPIFMVYEITERSIASDGQELLVPDIEVNSWWTNLYEDADTVIDLYHRHGTSEQFHSELKSDLGLERLPSGKFSTNDLILRLGMIAFNIVRLIGQTALKFKKLASVKIVATRHRLRTVLQDLIYISCKRVFHAGRVILKFGLNNPWVDIFRQLYATSC